MRVPDEIRQCVVFIGLPIPRLDGQIAIEFRGTAFFVGIESETQKGISYVYLVTAKHVATKLEGLPFMVRINTIEGGSELVQGQGAKWWYHPEDEAVDVAVIPYAPDQTKFEYKMIPTSMFLTDSILQEKSIGTGDEVFITGLFAHLTGSAKNLPIIRMGNIAMLPGERVPTNEFGDIEAYLIEARSIGGLSGSPVFVNWQGIGINSYYLFGLMHGHWDIPPQNKNDMVRSDDDKHGSVNMGIAIVVPAKKILEVINRPELVEIRKRNDEMKRKEIPVVLDENEQDQGATEGTNSGTTS
jgi:hypothetical protein